jgi:hypothetical protein
MAKQYPYQLVVVVTEEVRDQVSGAALEFDVTQAVVVRAALDAGLPAALRGLAKLQRASPRRRVTTAAGKA